MKLWLLYSETLLSIRVFYVKKTLIIILVSVRIRIFKNVVKSSSTSSFFNLNEDRITRFLCVSCVWIILNFTESTLKLLNFTQFYEKRDTKWIRYLPMYCIRSYIGFPIYTSKAKSLVAKMKSVQNRNKKVFCNLRVHENIRVRPNEGKQ